MGAFQNAMAHAKPECPKCHGLGTYMYDHNHGKICEICCQHNMGWFLLGEHYGTSNGKLCCLAGCGKTKDAEDALLRKGEG